MSQTPKQSGFTMPAEWENHSAVWLAWPYDETTFPERVEKAEAGYCKMIDALADSEQVKLLVLDGAMKQRVAGMLREPSNVNFHIANYADVWVRDYGPIFLVNKQEKKLGFVKAKYNGYGKAEDPYYQPLLKDNEVFNRIDLPGQKFGLDIVLEGGAVETNGKGVLITTEQCLLNPNRNPQLNKSQIEEFLKNYLVVEKIIWLKQGLVNDHTDGHVDDLAKFIAPDKILAAYEDNPKDENYDILKNNFDVLAKQSLEVIKLPMPHMQYDESPDGGKTTKAPVSYANFYISNKVILVPTYNDPNDSKALNIIQDCFPDRKVVPVDCRDVIYGGGAIHCMTQQQPALS